MAERFKLKASQIGKATKAGMQNDGGGLYLRTSKTLSQSWVFRYRQHGRLIDIGLGSASDVKLSEARELADTARKAVKANRDPKVAIRQPSGPMTFSAAAEQYIDSHAPKWSNAKHRDQWKNTLKTYADPIIGRLSVDSIEIHHIEAILKPIWYSKTETASRVRMRVESVLAWATAKGYRKGFNPAVWRGNLDQLLPPRAKVQKAKHFEAVPYPDLPAFYQALKASDSITSKALQFTILTACRTSEAVNSQWGEFDGDLWTIPADRMKARREHRVPLSKPTEKLLASIPENDRWVFPGLKPDKPLSNMAMLQLVRKKAPGKTVHGMRSAFRDWAAEETKHESEVVEMALAHVVGNKTEAAYRRGDLLAKRKVLMADWAKYLEGKK